MQQVAREIETGYVPPLKTKLDRIVRDLCVQRTVLEGSARGTAWKGTANIRAIGRASGSYGPLVLDKESL